MVTPTVVTEPTPFESAASSDQPSEQYAPSQNDPKTDTYKIIVFKNNFAKMEKEDMQKLKEGILMGILQREHIDYDVIQNITDIRGSCLIIKSSNRTSVVALQDIVNDISGYKCLGPDEENLGIMVKCLAPVHLASIIELNQFLRLLSLSSGNFLTENTDVQYAIPPKQLENKCTVLHLRLNYKAQIFFSSKNWRVIFPGTDFEIFAEEEVNNERVKPKIQLDNTPPLLNDSLKDLMV